MRKLGLAFAYYDEPTWALLCVIVVELGVIIGLLVGLVLP